MIQLKFKDIKLNILDTTSPSTEKEDFRLLVEYVAVLQEIDSELNHL